LCYHHIVDTLQKHLHVFTCWTAEGMHSVVNVAKDLRHHSGKDYPIQASTKDEMIVWIKAIEEAAVSYTMSFSNSATVTLLHHPE